MATKKGGADLGKATGYDWSDSIKKNKVDMGLGNSLPKQEKVLDEKKYNAEEAALIRNGVRHGIRQDVSLSEEEKNRRVTELDAEFSKYFKEDKAEGYKIFMEKYNPALLQKIGRMLVGAKNKTAKAIDDLMN